MEVSIELLAHSLKDERRRLEENDAELEKHQKLSNHFLDKRKTLLKNIQDLEQAIDVITNHQEYLTDKRRAIGAQQLKGESQ